MTQNNPDGLLGWIERSGNKLPDPVFIFVYCILVVVGISVLTSFLGVSAEHPTALAPDGMPQLIAAESLLSGDNLRRLLV